MTQRKLKAGYFVLAGLNSFATTYYFCYLFFYMHSRFGFGNASNLWLSALNGFVYMFAAWFGGRYAQRGYVRALRLGFIILALSLGAGSQIQVAASGYFVMIFWTIGVCFTWPSLEALTSETDNPADLPRLVGLYNIVWSGSSALAYFIGGALLKLLGMQSLFWLPMTLHLCQLLVLHWLQQQAHTISAAAPGLASPSTHCAPAFAHHGIQAAQSAFPAADPIIHLSTNPNLTTSNQRARPPRSMSPRAFLRLAWVANPFAYMAINTLMAMMPDLAGRFDLTLSLAGVFCSLWLIARMGAFIALWRWTRWHYRFRWLAGAYALTIVSFLATLLAPVLWIALLAQVGFGLGVGLIYYSSLFYSMDVGQTKGEHGGIHEAAIGLGIFTGPAVGAASLYLFPEFHFSGAWAMGGLLCLGGTLILGIRALQPRSAKD